MTDGRLHYSLPVSPSAQVQLADLRILRSTKVLSDAGTLHNLTRLSQAASKLLVRSVQCYLTDGSGNSLKSAANSLVDHHLGEACR